MLKKVTGTVALSTYLGQTTTSNGKCYDEILKIIQIFAENNNCTTHGYKARNRNYKSMCDQPFNTTQNL